MDSYDALGQIATLDGTDNLKHHYVYDGPQIISAFDGNGALQWEAVWVDKSTNFMLFKMAGRSGQLAPLTDHRYTHSPDPRSDLKSFFFAIRPYLFSLVCQSLRM